MIDLSGMAVVFDLDDTLYLERDYVRSGFRAVADEIAKTGPALGETSFEILWADFGSGVRAGSFDRLASALPEVGASVSVDAMIAIYRAHVPTIMPIPGVEPMLRTLKSTQARCGLITDGRQRQQQSKLDALRLAPYFDCVIINEPPDRFKPDGRSFRQIERDLRASGPRCWYVADNPAKDFAGPRQLGWRSIRLRLPGQLWQAIEATDPRPDFTVCHMNDVMATIGSGLSMH